MQKGSSLERIGWVDTVKFFGIFAIVLGHTFDTGIMRHYLYSFHVPLFFFAVGLFFQTSNKNYFDYIKKRAFSTLIPYFVFAAVSLIIFSFLGEFVANSLDMTDTSNNVLKNVLDIFKGTCRANRPLWFLPCMFIFSCVCFPLIRLIENQESRKMKYVYISVFIVLSMLLCFLNDKIFNIKALIWKVDVALFMLAFFFVAYGIMPLLKNIKMNTAVKCIIAVALLILGGVLAFNNSLIAYLGNRYGNVLIFYFSSIITILGICFLSMAMPDMGFIKYIGRHTLGILLMHKFPILFFQTVFPWTKKYMADNNIGVALIVTIISITACLAAEWIIVKICPFAVGVRKKKGK